MPAPNEKGLFMSLIKNRALYKLIKIDCVSYFISSTLFNPPHANCLNSNNVLIEGKEKDK